MGSMGKNMGTQLNTKIVREVSKVNLPVIHDLKNGKNIAAKVFYQLNCAWGLSGILVSMGSVFLAIN
jgi:hypothetical protein